MSLNYVCNSHLHSSLYVCIMAGGLGKRMKSSLPKVLHPVGDIPMVIRVIQEALPLDPVKILMIVGEYKKIIKETIDRFCSADVCAKIEYIIQEVPLGTGHAMQCTVPYLKENMPDKEHSWVLVLSGDVPLITSDTLKEFIGVDRFRLEMNPNDAVIMTQVLDNPFGRGRVFQTKTGEFEKIIEEKDCSNDEAEVKICNCGVYLFKADLMCKFLSLLNNNNKQGEYYLTDLPKIIKEAGNYLIKVWNLPKEREHEMMNINNPEELERANHFLSKT